MRAVHEGVVAYADQFTGYGNLVIVDHGDGAYSLYGYLDSMDVVRGDHLDAQAPLGAPVATRAATLPCTSSYGSTAPRSIPYNG